jgi:hypothetical protein
MSTKLTSAILALLLGFQCIRAEDSTAKFPMMYEGGSLPFKRHDNITVLLGEGGLGVMQKKQRHDIPIKTITEISYGQDVQRRVGEAIGVAVFTLGIGALLALTKSKKHYVGLTWNDTPGTSKGGVVFRVGKREYRGFVTALEGLTGLKAVDADSPGGTSKKPLPSSN